MAPLTWKEATTNIGRIECIVVHRTGAGTPDGSDNHWSIYLVLKNDQGSVRANMRADFNDITG